MSKLSSSLDESTVFKASWEPSSGLEKDEIKYIISFIYSDFLSYSLPKQGCANVSIHVQLKTGVTKILRVYIRAPHVAKVEQAVLNRVADILPVPSITRIISISGYQVAECDYVQGERLSDVLLDLPVADLKGLMYDLGKSLGAISQWGYGEAGVFDAKHRIIKPLDYLNFADETLNSLKGKKLLSQSKISSWETLFQQLSEYFPKIHKDRLVHGDFDPSNILVTQKDSKWVITGILDWEYAHSGSPMQDMASMLRDRESLPAEYTKGFLDGVRFYLNIPDHWEVTVNVCNALALLDCLNRTHQVDQPNRLSDILSRLYDQLSSTDLHIPVKPPTKKITVSAYNPAWPRKFECERQKILDVLGHNALEVYHIGSTSVPHLAAKPKLDIIVEVHDIRQTVEQLSHLGYQYKGEWNIPGKYGFTKRGVLKVNLHVYPKGHPEISCSLLFRDYLRENPDIRDAYAELKQQLIQDPNMMIRNQEALGFPQYTIEKSHFVEKVLDEIGYDLPRLLKPITKLQRDYLAQNASEEDAILCLKGTKTCGYATLSGTIAIHMDPQYEQYKENYLSLIDHWLSNQFHK